MYVPDRTPDDNGSDYKGFFKGTFYCFRNKDTKNKKTLTKPLFDYYVYFYLKL